jgi:hypothetical protein
MSDRLINYFGLGVGLIALAGGCSSQMRQPQVIEFTTHDIYTARTDNTKTQEFRKGEEVVVLFSPKGSIPTRLQLRIFHEGRLYEAINSDLKKGEAGDFHFFNTQEPGHYDIEILLPKLGRALQYHFNVGGEK